MYILEPIPMSTDQGCAGSHKEVLLVTCHGVLSLPSDFSVNFCLINYFQDSAAQEALVGSSQGNHGSADFYLDPHTLCTMPELILRTWQKRARMVANPCVLSDTPG